VCKEFLVERTDELVLRAKEQKQTVQTQATAVADERTDSKIDVNVVRESEAAKGPTQETRGE
jgi:hypothetical protein